MAFNPYGVRRTTTGIGSSETFGRITATRAHRLTFRPPHTPTPGRLPAAGVGITVLLINGAYREMQNPTDDELAAAELIFRGGFDTEVSEAQAEHLTAAGYGDCLHLVRL